MASLQAFVPNAVGQEGGPEGAPQYLTLSADAEPMRLDSLCMQCRENGVTTLLLTKIPFFREVVLMAFECPHCGARNNEVQMGGLIPDKGVRFELRVERGDTKSLSRQVVKGDTCTAKIPELDFEIPSNTQRGTMTTVEGLLLSAAENLRMLQSERRQVDAQLADSLDAFCARLDACAAGSEAFTLILDDPAGNSALEWFGDWGGEGDGCLKREFYARSHAHNVAIGCMSQDQADEEERVGAAALAAAKVPGAGAPKLGCSIAKAEGTDVMAALGRYSAPEEVMVFDGGCPDCPAQASTRMFVTRIPYFREVVVMCTSCDACGYRNSELRSGGEIPARGRTVRLQVRSGADLNRDVIKSETSDLVVPELDLELGRGTLGGRVTTVEGLLSEVRDSLRRTRFTALGDSAQARVRSEWDDFFARLEKCITGEQPFTLVLRDPLASCFISALTEDFTADEQLTSEEFVRDWEEDEEMGLHDMRTEEADFEQGPQGAP